MNQPQPQFPPAATPPQQQPSAAEGTAKIVYILYLASLVVGITAIVGVVMAYMNRAAAPAGLDTHFKYLIRTFWIGMLYSVVGFITMFFIIGFAVLLFALVWMIVRCVKGLQLLQARQPVPNPDTWLW